MSTFAYWSLQIFRYAFLGAVVVFGIVLINRLMNIPMDSIYTLPAEY